MTEQTNPTDPDLSPVENPGTDWAAFWHSLIPESEAAAFLGLTPRCLQGWRYRGGGPPFVKISARCIRYRRSGLRAYADARLRTSTSDPGPEPAI